jgi:hypothetical protein
MLAAIAAEVSALITHANSVHRGADLGDIIAWVKFDICAGYRKHVVQMRNYIIADGVMANYTITSERDVPSLYNPARSCPTCACKWGARVAFRMCDALHDIDISMFDQYSLGIYLHGVITDMTEQPLCNHTRDADIDDDFMR